MPVLRAVCDAAQALLPLVGCHVLLRAGDAWLRALADGRVVVADDPAVLRGLAVLECGAKPVAVATATGAGVIVPLAPGLAESRPCCALLLLHRAARGRFSAGQQRCAAALGMIAAEALQSVRSLRVVVEEAAEGFFVADAKGRYLDVNRAGCSLVRRGREEILRLSYADVLPPEELKARPIRWDALQGGQVVRIERPIVRGDGTIAYIELSGRMASDGRFLALGRDVTERRKTAAAVRESETRFRSLCDAAFDGIVLHEEGKIIDVNAAFAAMHGYEPDEMLGMPIVRIMAPESRAEVAEQIGAGHEGSYEIVAVRKDGSRMHVELCGKAVPFRGRTVRLAAGRDISQRKQAEAQLRRLAAECQRLTARVIQVQEEERLAVSRELHDSVGQMLAGLKMMAEYLGQRSEDAEETAAVARRIHEQADGALAAVRSLCHQLRPPVLDDLGVDCALESLVSEIERSSRIACHAKIDGVGKLPDAVASAIYRIGQEALSNMVRHGQATNCWVTFAADSRFIRLRLEHDGALVAAGRLDGDRTLGIVSMRERAAALGGSASVVPRDAGGTVLVVEIPVR